jgi:hypothetical protein
MAEDQFENARQALEALARAEYSRGYTDCLRDLKEALDDVLADKPLPENSLPFRRRLSPEAPTEPRPTAWPMPSATSRRSRSASGGH